MTPECIECGAALTEPGEPSRSRDVTTACPSCLLCFECAVPCCPTCGTETPCGKAGCAYCSGRAKRAAIEREG